VVVYKVDRLTRSLADFARMIELFDAEGVSFVAVTQQFNTTTSMGRLTLNVLLSFAQFEREVIGERIRDKVAASKRKGIWIGGVVPLGYEVRDRRLLVNAEEAQTVTHIFECYLELGNVRSVVKDVSERRILSAVRFSKTGNRRGGNPIVAGAVYQVLSNPIYVGEIMHKKDSYPGQHDPIVSRELWTVSNRNCGANQVGSARIIRRRVRKARSRVSFLTRTATRSMSRERRRANGAIATTFPSRWSKLSLIAPSTVGDCPHPRSKKRSQLPPSRCSLPGNDYCVRGRISTRSDPFLGIPEVFSKLSSTPAIAQRIRVCAS
jgi:hypothetical protein